MVERTDPRKATAERNVEAILDGAERLLVRRQEPSVMAVASEAGVSRPTVYAHFRDRTRLVEALVERAVERTSRAMELAEPERGPAPEAIQRLLDVSWEYLGSHEGLVRAAAADLGADAMRRAHTAVRREIVNLVDRGRREGDFRTDLSADWLVTSYLALIHAAAEAVQAGELAREDARGALGVTVTDLLTGRGS